MGVGYHYTSFDHWQDIKKNGLRIQHIYKEEMKEWFPDGCYGFWLWMNELSDEENLMAIIYQLAYRAQSHIVKLRVNYDEKDRLRYELQNVEVNYRGMNCSIEKWQINDDNRKAVIIVKDVQPDKIELVKEYNLIELLK